MCDTCGCGSPDGEYTILRPEDMNEGNNSHSHGNNVHSHEHGHEHDHEHDHPHSHSHERKIDVEQDILYKNNLLAERNRGFFEGKNILALNLVSSPGSGKTSILEKTIKEMPGKTTFSVIEGDQQTPVAVLEANPYYWEKGYP